MTNTKRSQVHTASIVLLMLGATVGVMALVSNEVIAQNKEITLKPTGTTVVKLGGGSVRVTRLEDSDAKVLCYMTEMGGISCVKN